MNQLRQLQNLLRGKSRSLLSLVQGKWFHKFFEFPVAFRVCLDVVLIDPAFFDENVGQRIEKI